ncbi:hypothetical protein SNE40_012555 [Patella caerulea]|uniref:28S ribosomal protein S30, mitochondrial n=1 Tax=Patella caerulea TaxID=87958 RepID=A0AAN8Q1L4_PATCE
MAASLIGRHFFIQSRNRRTLTLKSRLKYSSAVQAVSNEDVESLYPPVKPRFPPGNWTSMTEEEAWTRYEAMQEMTAVPTVKERLEKLTKKQMRAYRFPVNNKSVRVLEFQKNVTKSHLIKGLPTVYDSLQVDSLILEKIKPYIIEVLLLEKERLFRSRFRDIHRDSLILRNLIQTLLPLLYEHNTALRTSQVDEEVDIKGFWDRSGFKRVMWYDPEMERPKEFRIKYANDVRFQTAHVCDVSIRTENPLKEFLPIDDELCINEEFPVLEYHPKVFGTSKTDREKSQLTPGYNLGDPCEFGLVSFHNTVWLDYQRRKYGDAVTEEMRQGMGLTASFTWLLAQAYSQGFNSLLDVTYPMTTQTVLSDGQKMSFFAYQLNTIDMLKNNMANPRQNICWYTDETQLYEKIEDGKVIGFNDETCETLLKFLLMKPERRNINMKPTLPAESSDILSETEFISRNPLDLSTETN